ncbi:MAG: hypothetical protein K2F99_00755, partial [Muribaculaceae bacterium]|nr:hypothetical protein [Muribaculaceae bacterium]
MDEFGIGYDEQKHLAKLRIRDARAQKAHAKADKYESKVNVMAQKANLARQKAALKDAKTDYKWSKHDHIMTKRDANASARDEIRAAKEDYKYVKRGYDSEYESPKERAERAQREAEARAARKQQNKQKAKQQLAKSANNPGKPGNRKTYYQIVNPDATPLDIELDMDENVFSKLGKKLAQTSLAKAGAKLGAAAVKGRDEVIYGAPLNGDSSKDDELDEGTGVRGAVDSIMFSLESVSANKIKNCKSLTK